MRERTDYLMRHGRTRANAKNRFAGRDNFPLTREGKAQVRQGCLWLPKDAVRRIVTSTLLRAVQSANIVSGELGGVEVEPDERLDQFDMGDLTGRPYFKATGEQLDAAGGRESLQAFQDRHVDCVLEHTNRDGSTLFVLHGLGMRALVGAIDGLPAARIHELPRRDNGEVVPFYASLLGSNMPAIQTRALAS